jgi:hypothetical protein
MANGETEQTYRVTEVPRYDAGVLSDAATDRPDANLRGRIVETRDVLRDLYEVEEVEGGRPGGVVLRPKPALQLAQDAMKSLANELAFRFAKGDHDVIPIAEEAFYDLIHDLMSTIYGNDQWLYAVAYEIAASPNPEAANDIFRNRVLSRVDMDEILLLQQLDVDTLEPETQEMYESESDEERHTEAELWQGVKEWGEAAQKYDPSAQVQAQATPPVTPPTDPAGLGCVNEYLVAKAIAQAPWPDLPVPPHVGSYVHGFIQRHYLRRNPHTTKVFDRAIWDGLRRRGTISDLMKKTRGGGLTAREAVLELAMLTRRFNSDNFNKAKNRWYTTRLKPDIIDFSGPPGVMYEIKSRRSLDEAVIQLYGYKWCYDQVVFSEKWPLELGRRYRPPRFIPVGTKYLALPFTHESLPGIIGYSLTTRPETQRRRIERLRELSLDAKIAIGAGVVLVAAALLATIAGIAAIAASAAASGATAGALAPVTTLPTATVTGSSAAVAAVEAGQKAAGILLTVATAHQLYNQEEAALKVAAQPELAR